ncbi:MAG: hypothetical protein ACXWN4_04435 [Candidatus Limnocylindrales bacterium]
MAKSAKTPTPKRAPKTAETRAIAVPAAAEAQKKAVAKPASPAIEKTPSRHPNLGLAPVNMTAGFPDAAAKLRRDATPLAAQALEAAVEKDPTIKTRYDEVGLRRLLRDTELLVERLAMCLGSDNPRWLVEYAEWIAPIYRRRGVSLLDICALGDGIRDVIAADLGEDERATAELSLEAATAIWKRNSRLGGDRHKRNALWKWMYRGV